MSNVSQIAQALHNGPAMVVGAGRDLARNDAPVGVQQHQVGECPADIHTHSHGYHPGPRDRSTTIPDVV